MQTPRVLVVNSYPDSPFRNPVSAPDDSWGLKAISLGAYS